MSNYFQFKLLQLVCTLLGQLREELVRWQRETGLRFKCGHSWDVQRVLCIQIRKNAILPNNDSFLALRRLFS